LTWPIFLNIPKKVVNVILQGELWPSYRGNLADVVNVFSEQRFPVTRKKAIFCKISKFYFQKVGQGTVTKKIFPDGPWVSPYNESKNLALTREFGENMVQILRVEPLRGLGQILQGSLKNW